jgi:hypothetical protein
MRRERNKQPTRLIRLNTANVAVVALILLEIFGLILTLFVGWWVRHEPNLLIDVFQTYMSTLLLTAIGGLLGWLRGEDSLPQINAQRISTLEQSQSGNTPDMAVTHTIQKTITVDNVDSSINSDTAPDIELNDPE